MKIMKKLMFLITLLCNVSYGEIELEITQGIDVQIPIVVNKLYKEDHNYNISEIIANDMQHSGKFAVSHTNSDVFHYQDLSPKDFQRYKDNKYEYMFVGKYIKLSSDQIKVKYQLIDFFATKAVVKENEYIVASKDIRKIGHKISDEIYEYITGNKGAFSTYIAYIKSSSNNEKHSYGLEIADYDGYNRQTLMKSNEPIMSPVWSPNGQELAFVSFENKKSEIYTIDIISGKRKLISSHDGINGAPSWSPDGSKMALVLSKSDQPKIYTFDLKDQTLTKVTDGNSIDTEPIWSKEGNSIYFTSNRGGGPQIYKIDLNTKEVVRITYEGRYNASPRLSPDGTKLIVLNKDDRLYNLAVWDLSKGEMSIVAEDDFINSPSIAPNGKMIAYSTKDRDRRLIKIVSYDGRVKFDFYGDQGNVFKPAWSPQAINKRKR